LLYLADLYFIFCLSIQPHLRYYLVDEGRYTDEELCLRQTPLSGVFSIEKASTNRKELQQAIDRIVAIIQADPIRLEHNRDEQDMLEVLGTLVEWLKAPEQTGLRRSFVVWIRRVLLPSQAPEMELPEFSDLQDLHEVHDMLAERIKKWPEQWEARGEVKGEAKFLKMQIVSKYGECPDWAQNKLNAADAEQLEAWGKRIFRAETLEELLSD